MKKTYQVQRGIRVGAGKNEVINFQLKDNYARCTGFFLTPAGLGTDFSLITLGLNIAQTEILPTGCDASIFALTSFISRDDAAYKFAEENIPARSADVALNVTNAGSSQVEFNVYFILEN